MMTIRRAGYEGQSFCRSFFRPEESPTEVLGEELSGLAASFRALEHYPACQLRLVANAQEPGHG